MIDQQDLHYCQRCGHYVPEYMHWKCKYVNATECIPCVEENELLCINDPHEIDILRLINEWKKIIQELNNDSTSFGVVALRRLDELFRYDQHNKKKFLKFVEKDKTLQRSIDELNRIEISDLENYAIFLRKENELCEMLERM